MINFNPHYIFISKIFNRISYYSNWAYILRPFRWIAIKRVHNQTKTFNKSIFIESLQTIIGDFYNYPNEIRSVNDSEVVLEWAEKTINHEFEYLGSGSVKLDPIDWHLDFKTDFRWPKGIFYLRYKKVNLSNDADVKVPWELSRCHHLLWLGEAYLITKNDKYAKEIVDQLVWWIDENPLMYSINWTCAMDVAIRAVNWMYAINMISASTSLTDETLRKINRSLFKHGWFIFNNLEKWYPYSANHYAANISGLLYLGQLFKESSDGKKWWDYALKEYYLEVRFQVLPSGAHFERSISYHRLMTELFSYPYFMLERIKEPIPIDIKVRIESMFDFVDHYSKPNGFAPQVGDNDDGRLLPFVKRDLRRHNYLLNIGFLAFEKDYKNLITDGFVLDTFFLLPEKKVSELKMQTYSTNPIVYDHRDAGFVILKKYDLQLFFTNSSLSCYPDLNRILFGTHTHADGLSFELSVGKHDFIIDPGTYVYTASAQNRNKFRSTSLHNTVSIDGQNQVELLDYDLFSVKGYHEVEKINIVENDEGIYVAGSRNWKLKAGYTASHLRKIHFKNETEIEIEDKISCTSEHLFIWHFYLGSHIYPELLADDVVFLRSCDDSSLKISLITSKDLKIELIDCEVSSSYGILELSKVLKISLNSENDFTLIINLST